ncbi:hypothetical protein PGTUg99_010507 [Puccinia graminis f. sp. tritici]|uniref:Uncharacterized protein n=1 Tax=Puccinia graminis f. sp. tritici TaxID=56615 RepID=A0A5B0MV13_PUCGR|nr:hypothetical protein PGTUg99_010507 [Puccinia graminis f. sp. tritici]
MECLLVAHFIACTSFVYFLSFPDPQFPLPTLNRTLNRAASFTFPHRSQVIANFYAHTNPESHPFPHPIELCLSIASALSRLLLRPQRLLNLSLSRRRASTKQSPKPARLYTPTCTCAIGPNGGILLSPTAVKNLFNFPEFKHQKRAILPYKKWRLQRQRRLKDNKNKV